MSDWVRREAERIRQQDERNQEQERLQLHRAEILKVKAPIFFADAAKATEQAVKTFNDTIAAGRPERQLKVEIQPTVIGVGGMGSHLTATLENAGTGVITLRTESGQGSRTPRLDICHLNMLVDEQGSVSLRGDKDFGPELVAKRLLIPFIRHVEGKMD